MMTPQEGRAIIKANLDAALNLMRKGLGNNHGAVMLVTFPEMFLTLAPVGWRNRQSSEWLDVACVEVPGPELRPLFDAARDAKVYVGANAYERDPKWPGRYFNCSFLINPNGELILKYRRLHSGVSPSPHDFLDEYVEEVGWDALWPVADTEIGRIAMFPCGEITKPEVARMFTLKGAELLLHPTNDSDDFPGWNACKQARAFENNCYLISTNCGGWVSKRGYLETTNAGGTIMVDFMGSIFQEQKHTGESMKARGLIDIDQLRAHRHSNQTLNVIAQLRTELYTEYKKTITPPNRFKNSMKDNSELRKLYVEVMDRLTDEGLFPRPILDA
jgi:predicted amidohydrolase